SWPRLWIVGPVAGLRESLHRLNVQHMPEWFFGQSIVAPVPKWYFPAYFVAGVTPAILFGLAFCILRRDRATGVTLAVLATPFVLAFSPVVQNGLRYLMPALPAAALLAASGLDAAAARLRIPAAAVLAGATLFSLVSCVRVAPYYLDYYNVFFGGPRAALA